MNQVAVGPFDLGKSKESLLISQNSSNEIFHIKKFTSHQGRNWGLVSIHPTILERAKKVKNESIECVSICMDEMIKFSKKAGCNKVRLGGCVTTTMIALVFLTWGIICFDEGRHQFSPSVCTKNNDSSDAMFNGGVILTIGLLILIAGCKLFVPDPPPFESLDDPE